MDTATSSQKLSPVLERDCNKKLTEKEIRDLIKNNVNLNYGIGIENLNLLNYAIKYHSAKLVKDMIEVGGAIPHMIDGGGNSSLMTAAFYNTSLIPYLIKKKVDLNEQNEKYISAVSAILLYHSQSLPLIKNHPGINQKTKNDSLSYIIQHTDDSVFIHKGFYSLVEMGAELKEPDQFGYPPLFRACKGNSKIVKFLLDKGVGVDEFKDEENNTALLYHCHYQDANEEIIKTLIENGANINHENILKITPLTALINDRSPLIELLVNNGVNLNANSNLVTEANPLMCCCLRWPEKVQYLIDNGAKIDKKLEEEFFNMAKNFKNGSYEILQRNKIMNLVGHKPLITPTKKLGPL